MGYRYAGRVALVTGAAGGIGAALAGELARRGCRVALVDRDADGLARTAAGIAGATSRHALDVTDRDAIAALPRAVIAAHGKIDILVNNAGITAMGRFDEIGLDLFDQVMAVNFGAVVALTKATLPYLGKDARIANVSSVFGLVAPPGQSPYVASKFAVRGFSDALRHELADSGIRVTCVHPGGVRTGIAVGALVADGIAADRARAAQQAFSRFLRLEPATAAARIADAVAAGKPRLLIGRDARAGDLIARLSPGGYGRVLLAVLHGMKRHVGTRPNPPPLLREVLS